MLGFFKSDGIGGYKWDGSLYGWHAAVGPRMKTTSVIPCYTMTSSAALPKGSDFGKI